MASEMLPTGTETYWLETVTVSHSAITGNGINHAVARRSFAVQLRGCLLSRKDSRNYSQDFLPNYREFYEYRQFAPAAAAFSTAIAVLDQGEIPFGEHLIFQCQEHAQFTFFVEICEDLWVPIPPSCHAALAGATVILNLSASNITIAKDEYRHSLVSNQSARCLAGYLYTAAGTGESTTDLAWDGHES